MRRKIKELMNKEEGFTLVELLAVIVILGIIVAIAIPAVGRVMDTARTGASESEIELIEDSARLYDIEKPIVASDAEVGAKGSILVSTLISEGFLELRGADKDKNYEGGVTVEITAENGKTYTYDEDLTTETVTQP